MDEARIDVGCDSAAYRTVGAGVGANAALGNYATRRGVPVTPGPLNLLTDIAGIRVGHAGDARIVSGVTAIVFEQPTIVSVDIGGGGPGTRETDLLDPARTVDRIDAITLSGGSAFGLDAPSGVQAYLRSIGRGYAVGNARVPLVPAAILFDLLNGGDKDWGRYPPYRELGFAAAQAATTAFALGSVGAGLGATTVNLKGGIGGDRGRNARIGG